MLKTTDPGEREERSLKLDAPGRSYVDALGTVFVAASQILKLRTAPEELWIDGVKIDQAEALEKRRHHGFALQSIDDFSKMLI